MDDTPRGTETAEDEREKRRLAARERMKQKKAQAARRDRAGGERRAPQPTAPQPENQPVRLTKPVQFAAHIDMSKPGSLPPYVDPHGRKVMPRQKRLALKRARELNLDPRSHNHALYLLAQKGVDIFDGDESMLSIADRAETEASGPVPDTPNLPITQDPNEIDVLQQTNNDPVEDSQAERDRQINEIQLGLVRRRRRRLAGLILRLIIFVVLPTAVVHWYYANVATPMYETESAFVIQQSSNPASSGGLGGLLDGTPFAGSTDSIVVQEFLGSPEAFARLDEEEDYAAHFQQDFIDDLQRLPADASRDEAYAYFQDRVTIGYDITEGIIRMGVVGVTPEASQRFSEALVSYAEERVDGLTQEARGDQLKSAQENYNDAEAKMLEAEQKVLELQQQRGVLSADLELESRVSLINTLTLELENRKLELAQRLDNDRPNQAQIEILRDEIARREQRIGELTSDLTQSSGDSVSLARISGELRIAETSLQTRHEILTQAVASLEAARLEASRQVRFLSLGVAPIAPVEPTFPRVVEGTIIAFIVFLGIYILGSLTVSILREQVSV